MNIVPLQHLSLNPVPTAGLNAADVTNEETIRLLKIAVEEGSLYVVKRLVLAGVDPSPAGPDILKLAITKENVSMVTALASSGADLKQAMYDVTYRFGYKSMFYHERKFVYDIPDGDQAIFDKLNVLGRMIDHPFDYSQNPLKTFMMMAGSLIEYGYEFTSDEDAVDPLEPLFGFGMRYKSQAEETMKMLKYLLSSGAVVRQKLVDTVSEHLDPAKNWKLIPTGMAKNEKDNWMQAYTEFLRVLKKHKA